MQRSIFESACWITAFFLASDCVTIGFGQTCALTEVSKVDAPPPATFANEFGGAVAISGDWAIVGARGNDQLASNAGAAYILHREANGWIVVQTLVSPPDTPTPASDSFGISVAIDGNVAVVGSPGETIPPAATPRGAAHIYRFNGTVWQHEQRLIGADAQSNGDQLGRSVTIDGDVIVCGAPGDDDQASNAGSAYVFRHNGTAWIQEQKLFMPLAASQRAFGTDCAISNEAIVVGAPGQVGEAFVYRFNGATWDFEQTLFAPGSPGNEQFGQSVAIDGSWAVVGAPQTAVHDFGEGAVFAFHFNGTTWDAPQVLTIANVEHSDHVGIDVAIQGGLIIAGAPNRTPEYYPHLVFVNWPGAAYMFRLQRDSWVEHVELRAEWFEQDPQTATISYDMLGSSVAIDGEFIIVGAPMTNEQLVPDQFGRALFFSVSPPDCNADGTADACDPDCNNNTISDLCEIQSGSVADCNGNGVPDGCESGVTYQLDDNLGFIAYGAAANDQDYLWFNQFTVRAGGQRVTQVAFPWSGYTPITAPFTILVYDDPDNDGDPADAVLLTATPATAYGVFGLTALLPFTMYAIPSTPVGNIGDRFFVGGIMPQPVGVYGPISDNTVPMPSRSWRALAPLGQGNINTPYANPTYGAFNRTWLIHAIGNDCNGNGIADSCDIADKTSLDLNTNGIPDECDLPCPADITHTGGVDIDDLVQVITNWGTSGGPADINDDNIVNIDDLVMVITNWGACP